MFETLLSALAGFLAGLLRDLVADWRREAALKDLGRAEGAAATATMLAEMADDQARINSADRGSAGDVARRLRERLK